MSKKRDDVSVESSRRILEALGCPNPRRGEGSDEWERSKGPFPFTPDLVAGPLVGGGDPSDFYVDVFEPTGDQYVKPLAGNPIAASKVLRAIAEKSSFRLDDLADAGEQFLKPMNDKLVKYVSSRANTSMFGLAMYFRMTGDQYAGPIIAAFQALDTLDRAFGITHHLGHDATNRIMKALVAPGQSAIVLTLPIEQPLSFVLHTVQKADGVRVAMLVNHAVTKPEHPYSQHPVISWLRDLATPDAKAKAAGRVLEGSLSSPNYEPPTITIGIHRSAPPSDGKDT